MAAQPVVYGDIESLLLLCEDAVRQLVLHQLTQQELQGAALDAIFRGQCGGKLDNPMIQKCRTHLERMRHAHSVDLNEKVVGQIVRLIEGHEAPEVAAGW